MFTRTHYSRAASVTAARTRSHWSRSASALVAADAARAAVRVCRTVTTDPDAPPLLMVLAIDYPSLAAIEEALASPVRTQARAVTEEIARVFDGRFYHLVGQRLGVA